MTNRSMKAVREAWKVRDAVDEQAIRTLGDQIGYGRIMQLANKVWREKAINQGTPGSEFVYGPCAAMVVPCPHPESGKDENGHCDWCCGAGWVTEKVYKVMMQLEGGKDNKSKNSTANSEFPD